MYKKRIQLYGGITFFAAISALAIWLQVGGYVPDIATLQSYRTEVEAVLAEHWIVGVAAFILLYICIVGMSLPFATPLTVLVGFLFGNVLGTSIVAVAASIGATIAFLLVRYFFYAYVSERWGSALARINDEMQGNGFRDILLLRLTPIVPFALINIATALTPVPVSHFFLATILGTLPFTIVYVNAGVQLATLTSFEDIIAPSFVIGMSLVVLVATLPLLIRRRS